MAKGNGKGKLAGNRATDTVSTRLTTLPRGKGPVAVMVVATVAGGMAALAIAAAIAAAIGMAILGALMILAMILLMGRNFERDVLRNARIWRN